MGIYDWNAQEKNHSAGKLFFHVRYAAVLGNKFLHCGTPGISGTISDFLYSHWTSRHVCSIFILDFVILFPMMYIDM